MKKIIFFILLSFSTFYIVTIGQTKSEQLRKNKQNLEKEITNTQHILDQTRKNKKASLAQLSVLRSQISNREELIVALNNEVAALEEELELNIKLSKNLDRKLGYMKSDYSRVVYNAYKNRKLTNQLVFILSSEDFNQMFRRMKYYRAFSQNVKYQVDQINTTQKEISEKEMEIRLIKDEKVSLLSGQEIQLAALENEKREKNQLANSLKAKEKKLAADIRKKQQQQRQLDKAIKQAIEREIAAANAKKNKNKDNTKNTATTSSGKSSSNTELLMSTAEKQLSSSFAGNKGKLPWPVTKCSKIKDFGTYSHPDVPSVQMQNNGIDLLTEAGASVRAVFEGEVSGIIDYMGTKVLIVKHGEYLTVYQNLSTVLVRKGDKVTTKQTIGKVAKNSNSGTYELHFEVWKNTNFLNPNLWLAH